MDLVGHSFDAKRIKEISETHLMAVKLSVKMGIRKLILVYHIVLLSQKKDPFHATILCV